MNNFIRLEFGVFVHGSVRKKTSKNKKCVQREAAFFRCSIDLFLKLGKFVVQKVFKKVAVADLVLIFQNPKCVQDFFSDHNF